MARQAATRTYGRRTKQLASKAERLFAELKDQGTRVRVGHDVAATGSEDEGGEQEEGEEEEEKEEENEDAKQEVKGVEELDAKRNGAQKTKRAGKTQEKGKEELNAVIALTEQVAAIDIAGSRPASPRIARQVETQRIPSSAPPSPTKYVTDRPQRNTRSQAQARSNQKASPPPSSPPKPSFPVPARKQQRPLSDRDDLRTLSWAEVCPPGDAIAKIAEASFAEVYRVTNALGTSIIKTIRLPSPLKAQTATQVRSGLVDEEPHDEADVAAELQISEWLAAVPGFVVYKERYLVEGRATAGLLDTHKKFQARAKRRDPDRLQFYPSPSRYLDGTRFLVVELGDAGTALEDREIREVEEVWDVFLLVAVALARAEEWAAFEHRDLHEGNICVRQVRPPRKRGEGGGTWFGYSGLDITILDYGISRASDPAGLAGGGRREEQKAPIAFDLERDLSLFTSTHAPQCAVYRQMRSYLLRGDRIFMGPDEHNQPYALATGQHPDISSASLEEDEDVTPKPISWAASAPYTNVLWLSYLYSYLAGRDGSGKGAAFKGAKAALRGFRRETEELWRHLDPAAGEALGRPSFGSAGEVVRFAIEAGWIDEDEVVGGGSGGGWAGEGESILGRREDEEDGDDDGDGKWRRKSSRRRAR